MKDVRYRKNPGGHGEVNALLCCEAPRDDLISALVRAQEAGDQLSEAELVDLGWRL